MDQWTSLILFGDQKKRQKLFGVTPQSKHLDESLQKVKTVNNLTNIFKLSLVIVAVVALSGCSQEVGEKLVAISWPIFKYGTCFSVALLLLGLARRKVVLAAIGFIMTIFTLIAWWIYYLIMCPE